MQTDTKLMIFGGLAAAAVIVGSIFLHRLYKHVGRRCTCGEMWKNYHKSEIRFPSGDRFLPRIPYNQFVEFFHTIHKGGFTKFRKEFRWWRRDALLITFAVCPCCGEDGKRRIRVVTVSNRPISLWHLYWVWLRKRDQLDGTDAEANVVFQTFLRDLWKKNGIPEPEGEEQGNPPFQITLGSLKL